MVVPELVVNDSGKHEVSFTRSPPAVRSDGGFVVTWSADYPAEDHVYQRLYLSSGEPLGGEFQLSEGDGDLYPSGTPDVAVEEDDGFRVVWFQSLNLLFDALYSRVTVPAGNVGPVQELTAPTYGGRFSATAQGEFVVVHNDYCSGRCTLEGLRFDAVGNLVNVFPVAGEVAAALAHRSVDSRDFVLVQEAGSAADHDLYGWIFGTPLFADGFESGDTGAWSQTVP